MLVLKMAVSRFHIASNKKTAIMKQQMREIAKLLAEEPTPKEEKAKIRAEALIREDNTIEAYEILQLECELVHERIKLISSQKDCPEDLRSCICTLIWAANRVDIPELADIKKQFRYKYGKEFEEAAMKNVGGCLNERVVAKLSVQPPSAFLVQTYLEKIADEFDVDWKPAVKLSAVQMSEPMAAPVGYSVQVAPGTQLVPPNAPPAEEVETGLPGAYSIPAAPSGKENLPSATAVPYAPPPPETDKFEEPDIYIPAAPGQKGSGVHKGNDCDDDDDDNTGESSSYADLAARFSQLKK
uniref:IST1 homolog n=1 Tax=Odontella aurita TaxID=265563 RepID=A0A7S4JDA8_9STRA|mmetsp:Transcript_44182/g.134521  ORF Transcript_44182/g.134521 Transcript_44182/m.134521 type:complete len:298 (+) Transcript_44182:136-1029(+)